MPSPGPRMDRRSSSLVPRLFRKTQKKPRKLQWKDVIRWREHERGDLLLALPTADAIAAAQKTVTASRGRDRRHRCAPAAAGKDDQPQ